MSDELTITLSLVERTFLVGVLSDMIERSAEDGRVPNREAFNMLVELRAKINGTLQDATRSVDTNAAA